jgi:hypothetical protein
MRKLITLSYTDFDGLHFREAELCGPVKFRRRFEWIYCFIACNQATGRNEGRRAALLALQTPKAKANKDIWQLKLYALVSRSWLYEYFISSYKDPSIINPHKEAVGRFSFVYNVKGKKVKLSL